MEDSRNIIKAIDALTLKAGGEVVDSKNITEAIDRLKAVYDQEAIGIDKTLTQEGLAADAKAVGDMLSMIGPISIGNKNDSNVSVPNNTPTLCSTMTLTKGTWVVIGCGNWEANSNGYRQIAFTNALNPNRNLAITSSEINNANKSTYQQLVRFIVTNGEDVNLYALQDSGSDILVYPYLYAMKIK